MAPTGHNTNGRQTGRYKRLVTVHAQTRLCLCPSVKDAKSEGWGSLPDDKSMSSDSLMVSHVVALLTQEAFLSQRAYNSTLG